MWLGSWVLQFLHKTSCGQNSSQCNGWYSDIGRSQMIFKMQCAKLMWQFHKKSNHLIPTLKGWSKKLNQSFNILIFVLKLKERIQGWLIYVNVRTFALPNSHHFVPRMWLGSGSARFFLQIIMRGWNSSHCNDITTKEVVRWYSKSNVKKSF